MVPVIKETLKEGQIFELYRPKEAISGKKKKYINIYIYIFQTLYLTTFIIAPCIL